MKIGELAKAARTRVETIRYYEAAGLLPPPQRGTSNYRDYGQAHVERLRFVRNCRALDMTHDEIKQLLHFLDSPSENCGDVNMLLDTHITHVDTRLAELMLLKQQLAALRAQCHSDSSADHCGILQGLRALDIEPAGERHTHLG